MKIRSLILIPVFFVSASSAQTTQPTPPKLVENSPKAPCSLKSGDSPTLRGLRLDMPKALVQKEYPLMTFTAGSAASSGIALSHQISNPAYRDDIDRITVIFNNDKVFSILLTYDDSINWNSMEEFADKISESLRLPKAVSRKRAGGIYYSVNCGEFAVRTRINSEKQPTLFLTKDPDEIWESNKEKKDAFKP